MRRVEEEEEEHSHMKKTVDFGDLYDNINLQTGYENHSELWHQRVDEEASKLEKQLNDEDEKERQRQALAATSSPNT
jgi:vacuolar-type H+-ATPase subunit I/STV1